MAAEAWPRRLTGKASNECRRPARRDENPTTTLNQTVRTFADKAVNLAWIRRKLCNFIFCFTELSDVRIPFAEIFRHFPYFEVLRTSGVLALNNLGRKIVRGAFL